MGVKFVCKNPKQEKKRNHATAHPHTHIHKLAWNLNGFEPIKNRSLSPHGQSPNSWWSKRARENKGADII